jgi:hypothetical protein
MNKLIKEEINRIKEVMGLKLINESIVPANSIKKLLDDFAESIGKNLSDITGAIDDVTKQESVVELYNGLKNSTNQSVKNFVDSLDEVAELNKKEVNDLLDEISSGKVDEEISRDIYTRMASRAAGVDPNLVELMDDNFISLYNTVETAKVKIKRYRENMRRYFSDDENAYKRQILDQKTVRNTILNLDKSPFKDKLLSDWDEYIKSFDNMIKGIDDTANITDDVLSDAAKKLTADMQSETPKDLNSIANNSNLDGAIRQSIIKSGLFKGEQNIDNAVKEIRAKLIAKLEPGLKKIFTFSDDQIASIEKLWMNDSIAESFRQKLIQDAKKELTPLFSAKDGQWWINGLLGREKSTGKVKLIGTGREAKSLGETIAYQYVNSMFVATILALTEMAIRKGTNPKQVEAMPGDNYVEKYINSIGGMGPILQAFTPWGVGRLIKYLGEIVGYKQREPTQTQMSEYLKSKGIDVIPGNIEILPAGADYDSTLYPSEVVATVKNKVTGENYGLYTFDDKTEKIILAQGKELGSPTTTITDEQILKLWKEKHPDGVKKEDGKYYINKDATVDYVFDPETKTFK